MSVFHLGGRSTTNRRILSHPSNLTAVQTTTTAATSLKRSMATAPAINRDSALNVHGRRRALDLYGTKDVLISHEHMKKAQQMALHTGAVCTFG